MTVVLRDALGLTRTLKSLQAADERFEIVVVEGEPLEHGIAAKVLASVTVRARVVQVNGRDSGPYDAMNRGLMASSGQWVWFVNAGDEVSPVLDLDALSRILGETSATWAVGRVRLVDGDEQSVNLTATTAEILSGATSQCHQGVLMSRPALLLLGGFDTRYRIAADYDMMCRMALVQEPLVIGEELAVFYRGGISTHQRKQLYAEFFRIRLSLRTQSLLWHAIDFLRFARRVMRESSNDTPAVSGQGSHRTGESSGTERR